MNGLVEPKAVAIGAAVTIGIAVPAALVAQVLDDARSVDDNSSALLAIFAVIVLAMAIGGHIAARLRPDAPLTNSAVSALAAYLLVQGIGAVRLLAAGESVSWLAIPFFALLSAAAGMTGGLVADHRARNPRR